MRKHYFKTRDLVTIAILGCLGAVMSTYLGYIGQMIGTMTGIPYGSQVLTGLHVFWLVLILAVVDKKGAGLLGGCLNNIVQFLMGSHIGIWVLPVGVLQGLLAEIGYWPLKRLNRTAAMMLAGGLSAIAHIVVMQVVVMRINSAVIVLSLGGIAFVSGVCWGGLFTRFVVSLLQKIGLVRRSGAVMSLEDGPLPAK
ncbi:MAG TPA: ECF transporter S component [Telmatospirillum sp.]|nr:ECF transporter S component [Telmatospirillum sp.]